MNSTNSEMLMQNKILYCYMLSGLTSSTAPSPGGVGGGGNTAWTKIPAPLCHKWKGPSVNYPTQWDKGQPSTSRLRECVTSPSRSSPGSDLPRQAWVKLNRLCTGVGRFNAGMWRWGLSKPPACDCGADQQTANHIITECPLYRPPNGLHGLIDVDADAATCEWLLSKLPEI